MAGTRTSHSISILLPGRYFRTVIKPQTKLIGPEYMVLSEAGTWKSRTSDVLPINSYCLDKFHGTPSLLLALMIRYARIYVGRYALCVQRIVHAEMHLIRPRQTTEQVLEPVIVSPVIAVYPVIMGTMPTQLPECGILLILFHAIQGEE